MRESTDTLEITDIDYFKANKEYVIHDLISIGINGRFDMPASLPTLVGYDLSL